MASLRVRIHRYISWFLVASFFGTIITGYGQTQNWFKNQYQVSKIHRWIVILVFRIIYKQGNPMYTLLHS
ncbi:MAG: hypothetical protein GPJ51_07440 [Candidatus Heimdallarchaeota archaeon]|nr:hypothetical protein [Candidatus Heimdallarchaeota archaeon]